MPDRINLTPHDDVVVVEINNPPVNALSREVQDDLASTIAQLDADAATRAIVVVGAGRTFIAGADIKELEETAWNPHAEPPDLHPLLSRVENCGKPIVMAIHGTALGGGLELAMAGHYRIATADARLGLPEVNLGIIPGAEGTQRLPRLVGVEKALDMCLTGQPISGADAFRAGLVDRLAGASLTSDAVAFAREAIQGGGSTPRTRDRTDRLGTAETNAALFAAARERAGEIRRNQTAPLALVDAIEAAATLPFDEGRQRERALALQCLRSDQARALVHAFFAERQASKVPDVPPGTPTATVNTVTIVGAGTMGGGIAMACANAGLRVVLIDVGQDAIDKGLATIQRNYGSSVKRGRLSEAAVAERFARIEPRVGLDAAADADLVIEAVFENLALKKQVFAELDRRARPGCILATNTSTLDIDQIASATSRPDSVVGLHFFSPANVMRLLEIVRGRATSVSVLATALACAKRLGKVGVVVGNGAGFVGNRIMFPYMYEAQFLVEEGASPEQVDRVLTNWGMAMGIFAVDDMSGLDVAWRVRQELHQFEEPGARKPLASAKLVEMGRFGQKAGRGWYRYDGGRVPIPDPEVLALVESLAIDAGIGRRAIGDDEILERTIYALINEGARVLEEGIAHRAADIDVIYLTGYGFPAYRGGPMFHADSIGLRRIHERVSEFHRALGPRWAPAPLLTRLAHAGSTFREFDLARGASA